MNWETYKSLSPKLKEEYHWKFYDKAVPRPYFLVGCTAFVIFGMMLALVLVLTIAANPELSELKPQTGELLNEAMYLTKLASNILIPFTIVELIRIAYHGGHELYWQRKNKIKTIYWWNKNKEATQ